MLCAYALAVFEARSRPKSNHAHRRLAHCLIVSESAASKALVQIPIDVDQVCAGRPSRVGERGRQARSARNKFPGGPDGDLKA